MTTEMKRIYLEQIRQRYRKSTKKQKSLILDEFCAVCGYERKYAIRILWNQVEPRTRRPGPKRLKAALPLWLPYYREKIEPETRELLLKMSSSTIDRRLKDYRDQKDWVGGISATRGWVKSKIPLQLLDHEIQEPGHIEADTVVHCGNTLAGEFIHTLTLTDLYSGWTENRALWTKTASQVVKSVGSIESRLPFAMKSVAVDNGSEFLNEELLSYLKRRPEPIDFIRRRPYKKNDNAHVEQKNFTHVRSLFGYERFDDLELVMKMNEIYQAYWNLLWNYFTPCLKLKSKTRIGGRVRKVYDLPKTPAQRLIECGELPLAQENYLKEQLRGRNPIWLKQQLDKKLKEFWNLVEKKKVTSKVAS
jgi:hypothetical protein